MPVDRKNPKVNFYFDKATRWKAEVEKLRTIAFDCGLTEELKWGVPCYTYNKNNIVLIHDFKEYCAFLFFKGVLLKDPKKILIQQTKNVQAGRQVRFTSVDQINKLERVLKTYLHEAIEVEKAELKVEFKKTADFAVPPEFQKRLKEDLALKTAFKALTPGRQRAYLHYFSQAKQSKTREARVEKYTKQILMGRGLDD